MLEKESNSIFTLKYGILSYNGIGSHGWFRLTPSKGGELNMTTFQALVLINSSIATILSLLSLIVVLINTKK